MDWWQKVYTLLYRLVYGKTEQYNKLEIIGPKRQGKDKIIKVPAIRYTKFKPKNKKFQTTKFNYSKFTYERVNDSIAYLSVPSFGY